MITDVYSSVQNICANMSIYANNQNKKYMTDNNNENASDDKTKIVNMYVSK